MPQLSVWERTGRGGGVQRGPPVVIAGVGVGALFEEFRDNTKVAFHAGSDL